MPLPPAQDFKRVGDGDTGPEHRRHGRLLAAAVGAAPAWSTRWWRGSPSPSSTRCARRGTPFAGLLYAGLALTARGVRVIEFNARFGDPETQVVLARLATPLAGLLHAAATGALAEAPAALAAEARRSPSWWPPRATRARRVTGDVITGSTTRPSVDGAWVLHAGTRRGRRRPWS